MRKPQLIVLSAAFAATMVGGCVINPVTADRDLLIGGDERELAIARDRIDDAAADDGCDEGGGKNDQLGFTHITSLARA